jgi:hypothetical protein
VRTTATATAAEMTRKDEPQRVKTIRQNLLLGILQVLEASAGGPVPLSSPMARPPMGRKGGSKVEEKKRREGGRDFEMKG